MNRISPLFILTLFGIVFFGGTFLLWEDKFASVPENLVAAVSPIQKQTTQEEPTDTVTLLFVGDVLLDRGIPWAIYTYGEDNWRWPFLPIADTLEKADLVFGNLESQISDKGNNIGSIYSFRADPASIEVLTFGSFDVVSVANNHSFDYGRQAFEDSLSRLRAAEITYTGGGFSKEEAHAVVIKEVEDTRIGFLGYTNSGAPGWAATQSRAGITWVDWNSLHQLEQDITAAKEKVNILAVSLHAGEEYAKEPNEFQKAFAKASIHAGADLVIGHHPHVLQPLERYKDGWIIYSLGNFLFDQNFSAETMKGAILKVVVQDKKIQGVSLLPTYITPTFQVELAE